ncbi:tetratricopeptide repeat protein [Geomonas sp. RF6]|uniref:tetratricopeptide repeat protein n=1 Tax=Geomonas sp. RF6 TaxID=2897342 RepID=UPI001E3CD105|nr:tetratricopeptide repeat protein [Geomonas sp. RF6]UFS71039.1 tetratricopeptide repeat protein [Geomonas sp. RF6]
MALLENRRLHIALILLVGVAAYCMTFDVPFVFDDESSIVHNDVIRNLWTFLSGEGYGYSPRRFLGYLTIAVNYWAGGLQVAGYHVVNLVIHLACAILVYFLGKSTFRTPRMADTSLSERAGPVSLFAALLFVAHPVQTQAVTYVIQRLASLATFFYLLSLLLYVVASLRERKGAAGRAPLYLGSLLAAVLAMKTKEIAFTLPFAIVLYEILFFGPPRRERLRWLLPFALTLPIIPLSLVHFGPVDPAVLDGTERISADLGTPRHHYLFTQFRVIATYLRLLFLPVRQNLDYDYPLFTSFLEPQVALSFLLLAAILCAAFWLIARARRSGDSSLLVVSFGTIWFFLALSVESSVIPIKDVIFEHRLYLPSVGAFLALATGGALLARRLPRGVATAAAGCIVLLLAGSTFARNQVWRDEVTLTRDIAEKSPEKARVHANLAAALLKKGELDEALREAELSARLNPAKVEPHNILGMLYGRAGAYDRAIAELSTAVSIDPKFPPARENLGDAYRGKGMYPQAIEHYQAALKLQPLSAELYNKRGTAYGEMGDMANAAASFAEALRLDPANAVYRANARAASGGSP